MTTATKDDTKIIMLYDKISCNDATGIDTIN